MSIKISHGNGQFSICVVKEKETGSVNIKAKSYVLYPNGIIEFLDDECHVIPIMVSVCDVLIEFRIFDDEVDSYLDLYKKTDKAPMKHLKLEGIHALFKYYKSVEFRIELPEEKCEKARFALYNSATYTQNVPCEEDPYDGTVTDYETEFNFEIGTEELVICSID